VLLSVMLEMREAHEDWLELGRDLIARGLGGPLMVVADGAPGPGQRIEQSWPASDRQHCCVHRVRNLLAKLPERERERVRSAYWQALDDVTTERDAKQRLQALVVAPQGRRTTTFHVASEPERKLAVLTGGRRRGASAGVHPWRTRRVDLGEAADLAGDGEQVVGGVDRLLGGVQFVEHRADQRRLADVLRDADPLRIRGTSDRCISAICEPDRGRVQGHAQNSTGASEAGPWAGWA
jgi:Transposase, Mutator family